MFVFMQRRSSPVIEFQNSDPPGYIGEAMIFFIGQAHAGAGPASIMKRRGLYLSVLPTYRQ